MNPPRLAPAIGRTPFIPPPALLPPARDDLLRAGSDAGKPH
ncbi:hypothetical protein [Verminephrobacter eiseniae]|nr:hypothetical protein [Verminephrobacter eiseniae]